MASLFTKIIRGEIPCEKILEDEDFFAFLDIRPIRPGHTLVVPKAETDCLWDLPPELLSGALPFAQKIVEALPQAIPCKRVGMLVAGFEVPHAHIHLVPLDSESQLDFSLATPADRDSLKSMGALIRSKLGV
jgi:histidine triad (HIT) family protein